MNYTFEHSGKYVDSVFECFTQDGLLHIVEYNREHDTGRVYSVGRIALTVEEFFVIFAELAKDRDDRFDVATQYCSMLMNMTGNVSLQTARELWRVTTHQADNFLVLTGNSNVVFRVLALDDDAEAQRLEESFGDQVVASCRKRKVKIMRRGFK